ncbi:reverse transcriptase domain-containing protein [Tanacetum coccineum]
MSHRSSSHADDSAKLWQEEVHVATLPTTLTLPTKQQTTSCGVKEFFGTEGAVGLLTWLESTESMLHISKCPTERQVEFESCMLQGRALTWWNSLVQTRGRASAIPQHWEDFKKLLMEEYCSDDEIQKLESEF